MAYTNSSLVNYTCYSPNHSGTRTHSIDRITPHCVVGQCTVESLGNVFLPSSRQASSNYGIGYDGKVGLYVDEQNRSWCSSSGANDQRAITIEIASDNYAPYAMKDAAINTAIKLMADICKRNGKTKLIYISDKNTALSYNQASNEMLITLHQWFASTMCPGEYLISKLPEIVSQVNAILDNSADAVSEVNTSTATTFSVAQSVINGDWGNGQSRITSLTNAGYDATEVQKQVDAMLGKAGHGMSYAKIINYYPEISKGSTETYFVKILQAWLIETGYLNDKVDGSFGNLTLNAVKDFQSNIKKVYGNINVDGVVGSKTWSYIIHA